MLVTGPTGSGKTTSLYAALNQLNTIEKNIITIEEPVEYQLEGISRSRSTSRPACTFASRPAVHASAEPDIIMVGEIRDRETAQIAIDAALTGHLVLRPCTRTTRRPPSRVWSTWASSRSWSRRRVDFVVTQRLARRVCLECNRSEGHRRSAARQRIRRPAGTSSAFSRWLRTLRRQGLQGARNRPTKSSRSPKTIRSMILERANSQELEDQAIEEGMDTLRQAGLTKDHRKADDG